MSDRGQFTRQLPGIFIEQPSVVNTGLTTQMLQQGIMYTYRILDLIDKTLIEDGAFPLSQMMELANLSTFVGNLLGSGIAGASQGAFTRNRPHQFPDLLSQIPSADDVEIKVALESNKPKGHLAKPGQYITCRYVLGDMDGTFVWGQRGNVVWIWEMRCGLLDEEDFSTSNTEGDSGKTAVVNQRGMSKLEIAYFDINRLPYSPRGRIFREYQALYSKGLDMSK